MSEHCYEKSRSYDFAFVLRSVCCFIYRKNEIQWKSYWKTINYKFYFNLSMLSVDKNRNKNRYFKNKLHYCWDKVCCLQGTNVLALCEREFLVSLIWNFPETTCLFSRSILSFLLSMRINSKRIIFVKLKIFLSHEEKKVLFEALFKLKIFSIILLNFSRFSEVTRKVCVFNLCIIEL